MYSFISSLVFSLELVTEKADVNINNPAVLILHLNIQHVWVFVYWNDLLLYVDEEEKALKMKSALTLRQSSGDWDFIRSEGTNSLSIRLQ